MLSESFARQSRYGTYRTSFLHSTHSSFPPQKTSNPGMCSIVMATMHAATDPHTRELPDSSQHAKSPDGVAFALVNLEGRNTDPPSATFHDLRQHQHLFSRVHGYTYLCDDSTVQSSVGRHVSRAVSKLSFSRSNCRADGLLPTIRARNRISPSQSYISVRMRLPQSTRQKPISIWSTSFRNSHSGTPTGLQHLTMSTLAISGHREVKSPDQALCASALACVFFRDPCFVVAELQGRENKSRMDTLRA